MKFPSISFDDSNQPRMLKNECVREGIIKRNCQNTNYVFTSVGWVSSPSTCSACNFLFDESSTPHPIRSDEIMLLESHRNNVLNRLMDRS